MASRFREQWRKTGIAFPPQPKAAPENQGLFRSPSATASDSIGTFDDRAAQTPVQPIRNNAPKIGRNDPCPCGSGKKYKKCCGK